MTNQHVSPYQITLDIPFMATEGKISSSADLPGHSFSKEPSLGKEASTPLMPGDDQGSGSIPGLNALQISFLDRLIEPQALVEPAAQATTADRQLYPTQTILRKQEADREQIAIAPEESLPILEPYILTVGTVILSPGGHFSYRILGACCRLFDRGELPWPCCRIQWRSKEPSWRRIGKRFVPDLATKRFPSYVVEILDHEYSREPFVLTLYWLKFPSDVQNWWYTRYVPDLSQSTGSYIKSS